MALSLKQQAFIEEYLICFNATEAAKRAGYSDNQLNTNASKLLQNTTIKAEVDRRLKEKHLSAVSVLARMSDMANSDIALFADVRRISDLKNPEYKGKTHVIKKFKSRIITDQLGRQIEEVELELYGADGMLDKMARFHGLYKDKVELSWRDNVPDDMEPDEVKRQFIELMKMASNAKS